MTALDPRLSTAAHGRSAAGTRRHAVPLAVLACAVSFAAFWVAQRLAHVTMVDLMVYRAEGWTARRGTSLYDMVATSAKLPDTYPPFAALLFTPLTLVGVGLMRTLATLGNLLLLLATVHLSLRLVGRGRAAEHGTARADSWSGRLRGLAVRAPLAATFGLSALLVWCEPVWTTARYGQINLLVTVLVLWDLTRADGHRLAGAGVGLAAGIKLTPALFAVCFALTGLVRAFRAVRGGAGARGAWNPWLRQAAVALATFAATVGVSAVLLPRDSLRFWTEEVFATNRVGEVEITADQSLHGALARLLHSQDPGLAYTVAAAVVTLAGLAVAVTGLLRAPGGGDDCLGRAWSGVVCAVTALLVSPISWSHHWVWGVPLLVLLGTRARAAVPGGRSGRWWWTATVAAGVVLFSFALWWVPHRWHQHEELHQNAGQMVLSDVYPLLGLGFLVLAAVRLWGGGTRRRRAEVAA